MKMSIEEGFTLIELLVVLSIIGILTATAIPAYQHYRAQGFDFRALSDVRMLALAEEANYLQNEEYLACEGVECQDLPGVSRLSKGVEIEVSLIEEPAGFQIEGFHPDGTGQTYRWNSNRGGLQSG